MNVPDLFGGETVIVENSPYKHFKQANNYRLSTGNERCKNCFYSFGKHYAKRYYKCKLMGNSASPASDIRLRDVCNLWKGI